MPNLTVDFYCIESSTDVHNYWYMMTIVDAAFELVNAPAPQLDADKLNYYQLFASDADHPDYLSEEDIELIFEGLSSVFWYIDEVKFPKAIRKWYELITKTDHWKNHNDPGNLLYIKETIQRMVETAWLWNRMGFPELNVCGVNKKYVADLSAAQIADPIAYIGYFFKQHGLQEWKRLLAMWLMQSLSDEPCHDTEVTQQDCSDMIRLVQVARLIEQGM